MIDSHKVQEAQAMVQAFGALTNASPLVVQQVKQAVPSLANKADCEGACGRLCSGLLNICVSKKDDHVVLKVDATIRGGQLRSAEMTLD